MNLMVDIGNALGLLGALGHYKAAAFTAPVELNCP